ncbi:Ger(x)C family spore germination protein [Agathobaculum sp.]|uniref:Ger(x)C family spore germination protein n=1 Tax=Agathobaculum sp. TaxID=2048138 RepID=UPI002A82513F|nr:hypothetical protein [Agathobaculum sp.]MDY3617416.1 hypothetical protein [Agathobaculum sp.]
MKKLLLLLALLPLAGCAREVSPVSGLALDQVDGGYRLTAEVVRQDSPEDAASPAYLSANGRDMDELLRNIERVLGNELYLDHAQVVLIDEKVAKEGILTLADYLCQHDDMRLSLRVAVVRDSEAAALLQADDEVFALSDLLDLAAEQHTMPDMPLYRATEVLHADGTAILPALRLDEFEQIAPAGVAVFANEKLSCYLDGEMGGGLNA